MYGAGHNTGDNSTHLVVHVKPLRMVVQLFSLKGDSSHEAKSLIKRRKSQWDMANKALMQKDSLASSRESQSANIPPVTSCPWF